MKTENIFLMDIVGKKSDIIFKQLLIIIIIACLSHMWIDDHFLSENN